MYATRTIQPNEIMYLSGNIIKTNSTNSLPHFMCRSIDIQCEVIPVPFSELSKQKPGESSASIRERVIAARQIQAARFANTPGVHCNAQMSSKQFREYCVLDAESQEMMRLAMDRLGLSARAYDRVIKVARTIADLSKSVNITSEHLAEALTYRSLDRDSWGR